MDNPFSDLRNFIENIDNQAEFADKYITILAKITEINKLFMNISIIKTDLGESLAEIITKSNDIQDKTTSLINECEYTVESIKYITDFNNQVFNFENLNILPIDEFYKEANISEEEKAALTGTNLMKKQMEFELERFQTLKENYKTVSTRSNELKAKLFAANRLYAPIITKLRELDDVIGNFKKLHPDLF